MGKLTIKKLIYLISIIVLMTLIFWFSNQPGNDSSNQSNFFVRFIINIFNINEKYSGIVSYIVRKTAHFTIYFMLGFFVIKLLNLYDMTIKNKILLALLLCMVYACSDEIHQLFVIGRSCKVTDMLIDTIGSSCSIYIFKK